MSVRWDDSISSKFHAITVVCQGRIMPPFLCNVYMDDRSTELTTSNMGGKLSGQLIAIEGKQII